ncbi:MAG: hypothetical protein KAG66_00570, partial [Methylococcales bacterium]|nr:hypothetical protein [Methylococcales bacterium]
GRAPDLNIDEIANAIDAVPIPTLKEHEAPTLSEIEIGEAPEVTLPEFNPSVTFTPIEDPPDLCDKFQHQYDTALPAIQGFIDDTVNGWMTEYAPNLRHNMSLLQDKLELGMQSGHALSDEFETALYTRARTRADDERERVQTEIESGAAKRGFTLPPGVVNAGRVAAHQNAADNIAAQAMELAIERAKMEVQHVQFSMQLANGVHQMLISSALQYAQTMVTVNGQAIEYATQAATLLATAHELLLKKAEIDIAILSAEARVYETELKAALAVYERFRLELETAKMQTEVDLAQVTLYSKAMDAETVKVQQYVAILDGIGKRAELEKLKVDIYGEQVKSYVATLSGVKAETDIYVASLKGDESKLRAELAKVDVYAKQVDAAATQERTNIERMRAVSATNQVKADQYKAQLAGYQSEVQAEAQSFRAETDSHSARMSTVVAQIQSQRDVYKSEYDAVIAGLEVEKVNLETEIFNKKTQLEIYLSKTKLKTDTNVAVGQIYSGMASAALSSQNTMVSKILTE